MNSSPAGAILEAICPVADLEGAGGTLHLSPEIYHLILVKFTISDSKYVNLLLFLSPLPSLFGPPPFSKFLDPPLRTVNFLIIYMYILLSVPNFRLSELSVPI
jgi:hypothetical protein